MLRQNHWTAESIIWPRPKLVGAHRAQAVVIGGGMAGLTVAQQLVQRGVDRVFVLDARYCGAGATGKSSAFITPASELGLAELRRRFGDVRAQHLWNAATEGCRMIEQTIESEKLDCEYLKAESLYVASDRASFHVIDQEHNALRELGYESRLYDQSSLTEVLGGNAYGGGVRFGRTFAMNPLAYIRGLAERLEESGVVTIHEESPVVSVVENEVRTADGSIQAESVFFCLDHAARDVGAASSSTYHAQTFLTITEPLDGSTAKSMFPEGPMLVWDTDLIYQYLRLTPDRRLLLGGGQLRKTYADESEDDSPVEELIRFAQRRFPQLEGVRFERWWSGLIGVTRDLLPLAGRADRGNRYFYALCAAGLPWSALAARVAVDVAVDGGSDLTDYFQPRRSFTELDLIQPFVGKRVSFALSHGYTKYLLRGDARDVGIRKKLIAVGSAAAALYGVRRLRRRFR